MLLPYGHTFFMIGRLLTMIQEHARSPEQGFVDLVLPIIDLRKSRSHLLEFFSPSRARKFRELEAAQKTAHADNEIAKVQLKSTKVYNERIALEAVSSCIKMLHEVSDIVQLPTVIAQLERVSESIVKKNSFEQIANRVDDLTNRICDTLNSQFFLHIKPEMVELYNNTKLFGEEVTDKFPDAAEDIENAGKCLALVQGTACVFHLMRAMECAVQTLGRKLNVTVIDTNNVDLSWGKIIANITTPVEAMPKGSIKDRWSEAVTLLVHLKQTWRNPTMHPKKTYTAEQANKIFVATRSFLMCLAVLI